MKGNQIRGADKETNQMKSKWSQNSPKTAIFFTFGALEKPLSLMVSYIWHPVDKVMQTQWLELTDCSQPWTVNFLQKENKRKQSTTAVLINIWKHNLPKSKSMQNIAKHKLTI